MEIKRNEGLIKQLLTEPDDLGWLIEFTERIGRSHAKGRRMTVPKASIKFKHYEGLIDRNKQLFKAFYNLTEEKTKYIIEAKP